MPVAPSEALWLRADDLACLWGLRASAWVRLARQQGWPIQRVAGIWCLPKAWAAKRLDRTLGVLAGLRDGSWFVPEDPAVVAWAAKARASLAQGHPLLGRIHRLEGTHRIAIATEVRDHVEALAYRRDAKRKAPA